MVEERAGYPAPPLGGADLPTALTLLYYRPLLLNITPEDGKCYNRLQISKTNKVLPVRLASNRANFVSPEDTGAGAGKLV